MSAVRSCFAWVLMVTSIALAKERKSEYVSPEKALRQFDLLIERESPRQAIAMLQKSIEQNPKNFLLHSSLSLAYSLVDDHVKSIHWGERALTLSPNDAVVLSRLIFTRGGICDWRGLSRSMRRLSNMIEQGFYCNTG
ncbi:hypothetical protein GUITHDRAFT_150495, partial [Guillardia theta CCMP2712]